MSNLGYERGTFMNIGIGELIGIISVVISVWFAQSAKKDAEKAQNTLDNVNKAIDGWQEKIMSATASILDSQPQVIEGKVILTKIETANQLAEGIRSTINDIATNPQPGASGYTQQETLKILTTQLTDLLEGINYSDNKG